MTIYEDPNLPTAVVAGDIDGEMWIVPEIVGGWACKSRYAIPAGRIRQRRLRPLSILRAASIAILSGCGIPSGELAQ